MALQASLDPADYAYAHPIRVRFGETDAMGVVHHRNYLLYLEEARVAYLRSLGHPYLALRDGGIDFAVIEASVQYRRALHFDEVADVYLRIGAVKGATFQAAYLVAVKGRPRATAVTVHGCIDQEGRATRMPAYLRDLFSGVS